MQSLPVHKQRIARVFEKLHDENMSDERWNPADQVRLKYTYSVQYRNFFNPLTGVNSDHDMVEETPRWSFPR